MAFDDATTDPLDKEGDLPLVYIYDWQMLGYGPIAVEACYAMVSRECRAEVSGKMW